MIISKFKKADFYINLFVGVEKKAGYIFSISDNDKKVDFTLFKTGTYWNLSELTTGLKLPCCGFTTRQYAIDFILQYDAELFHKVFNQITRSSDFIELFNKKIADYEAKNAA